MKNEHGLTQQREKFARCVAEGMSGADAYRTAFKASRMKADHIHVEASQLLADPRVARRVAALQAELAERSLLKAEDVLRETARVLTSSPARLIRVTKVGGAEKAVVLLPHELDPDTAAAVASFEMDDLGRVKYKFWDKTAAANLAARLLGMFEKDNSQKNPLAALLERLSGNVVVPVASAGEDKDN